MIQKKNIEKYINLLKQYEEELKQVKIENTKKDEKLKNVQNINDNDIKKFQKEILELNTKISEFKNKLTEKDEENKILLNELESNKIHLDEKHNIIEKINKDYEMEHEKVKNLEEDLKNNKEKLNNTKNLISKYESDLELSKKKINELNILLENTIKEKEAKIDDIINFNDNNNKIREKESNKLKSENDKIKSDLSQMNDLNKKLESKNNELNNLIQLKDNEINNLKKVIKENNSQKINDSEFQKILAINNELIEKIKNYEKKEKEYLIKIEEYKIKENENNKLLLEKNNNSLNNINNEIKQMEQKKENLNNDIYNLTLKLSELEQQIKEKQLKQENNQIQENNQNQQVNKDIIRLEYTYPPNIGLNNVGATCFMNSTLQCLSHTKRLTNYFLNPSSKERIIKNNIALKNPNDLQLSPLYLELISKLWAKDNSRNYSPYNFMNGIQSMNSLFKKGEAGDAKDFIIYILEQLHLELKKNSVKNKVELGELNQYDKNNAIQHFFADFQEEVSIISDIFFGFNETTNICLACKNEYSSKGQNYPISYNYGIFNCIIFPLEEVKKMKNKFMEQFGIKDNMGYDSITNKRVSLVECFIYNQKTDIFTGQNQNYCNNCKQTYDSLYTSKIYVSPNVLILILNRGKGNIYDVKLYFTEIIDITQFVLQKESPQIIYSLYGVITHIGQSGPNAHFIASCKSPVDNKWYRYNDAIVSSINDVQKEVIEFGTPYILFYKKISNNTNK